MPSGDLVARVLSFRVSRPVLGSVTPKQAREVPFIRGGRKECRWEGLPNLDTGWVAYTFAWMDCAPAMPAPLLLTNQYMED